MNEYNTDSIESPDPPPTLGCILKTVSNKSYDSFCAVTMSAFSCNPNTSGSEFTGNDKM